MANIVDCDLLEAAKENVQPLAMGRRVTALSEILATPHAHRESKLAATRNKFRINVELALEDEDGDPLEAYCRLVYWTVENYPQGHSAESGLLELLEEATRVLKDVKEGGLRGDLKYLKLWLLYASFVEKPTIIYKFLIANDIGTQHALLYEEHAAVLERDGRYVVEPDFVSILIRMFLCLCRKREADDTYALGIARKAEPLDHLKSRYEDFQKRMMSNIYLPVPPPLPPSHPPRQALAPTLGSSTTSSSQSSRTSSSRTLPSFPSTSHTPQHNSRLQIFVDPTGEQALSTEPAAARIGDTNEWNELGTRKTRIKENSPDVKKMSGSTIKQPGKSKRLAAAANREGTGSNSKIMVFRDPAPEDMPPTPVPASSAQRSSGSGSSLSSSKGIVPFVDKQHEESAVAGSCPPCTPSVKFTPFRDEVGFECISLLPVHVLVMSPLTI